MIKKIVLLVSLGLCIQASDDRITHSIQQATALVTLMLQYLQAHQDNSCSDDRTKLKACVEEKTLQLRQSNEEIRDAQHHDTNEER